jgi:hypothetical protein
VTMSMPPLDNPTENPCFGCGPLHPRGLRMSFERVLNAEGNSTIESVYVPRPDEIGWPGLLHGGLHYLLLHEISYWTALTLGGKVPRFGGHAVFHQERLPRVGRACAVRAWIAHRDGALLAIQATTTNDRGARCGSLESLWSPASRRQVEESGLALPEYLLAEMDP